ncbi:MAG TPA: rod shape-determining protein MreC [Actinomycetota bacterium]
MALYRRARNTRALVITLVTLSLVTITIDYRGGDSGPFEVAGRATLSAVGALQGAVSRLLRPAGSFFSGISHVGSLQEENERLRERIAALERQNSEGAYKDREIEQLRSLLNLKQGLRLSGVTGNVIGESVSNFAWLITVDRGSVDGVRVHAPVVSGQGLVGQAVRVAPRWSQVELIIDPDSAVAGRLAASGETGLIKGQRADDLTMDLVNPKDPVVLNEQVVTSGYQGGVYPPGILVGFVSKVQDQPGGLFKRVDVRPAVDFSALQFVLIVTKR